MKGSELLLKALKNAGVKYIFGYTGGAIMPVFDEMVKRGDFAYIKPRNEQGAAFMAQGLTRASCSSKNPQIGICISTSGPGAMNLVTGIADAMMDSIPLLAITGQVAINVLGTDAFQENDVVGVMMPITKQSYMPLTPEEIEETVYEALYIAKTGRGGPVSIDLPKNVQMEEVNNNYKFNYKNYKPNLPGFYYNPIPDRTKIKESVSLINKSSRPIILGGHGIIQSNAGTKLLEFAKKTNIPIALTLHGISAIPADHDLNLGMMGMHGTVEANRAICNADLIIAFGMRFDDRVTGKLDEYAENADVIHVEIDPSEIDKNVKTTIGINADTGKALDAFLEEPGLTTKPRHDWFSQIAEYRKEISADLKSEIEKGVGSEGKLLMKTIIHRLSEITKGNDIVVSDVGQHQMMTARFYNFQRFNTWITSGGSGTMGAGIPMALGARLARPNETVWCVCGDGGFQMNIQELGTIMEYNLDIKIIIMNNGFLGMVRQWQTLFFEGRFAGTPMKNPDFGIIAKAYGITYEKVERKTDIDKAIKSAMNHKGANIIEFVCDPTELVLPMIPAGAGFEKMITRV